MKENTIPNPILGFLRKWLVISTVIAMLFLALIVMLVRIRSNAGNPDSFATYGDLETLSRAGKRFVILDRESMELINFSKRDWRTGGLVGGINSSYPRSVSDFYTISLSDGIVLVADKYVGSSSTQRIAEIGSIKLFSSVIEEGKKNIQDYFDQSNLDTANVDLARAENLKPLILTVKSAPASDHLGYLSFTVFLLYLSSFGAFAYFAYLTMVSGMIFIHPEESKTYKILAEFGNPESFFQDCETLLEKHGNVISKDQLIFDDSFVIIPYWSYVYVAPMKEMLWAYLAMHHWFRGYPTYRLHLCFSTGAVKIIRVDDKEECLEKLRELKDANPNVIVGHNQKLARAWDDLPSFIDSVRARNEDMQSLTSIGEQRDIFGFLLD